MFFGERCVFSFRLSCSEAVCRRCFFQNEQQLVCRSMNSRTHSFCCHLTVYMPAACAGPPGDHPLREEGRGVLRPWQGGRDPAAGGDVAAMGRRRDAPAPPVGLQRGRANRYFFVWLSLPYAVERNCCCGCRGYRRVVVVPWHRSHVCRARLCSARRYYSSSINPREKVFHGVGMS